MLSIRKFINEVVKIEPPEKTDVEGLVSELGKMFPLAEITVKTDNGNRIILNFTYNVTGDVEKNELYHINHRYDMKDVRNKLPIKPDAENVNVNDFDKNATDIELVYKLSDFFENNNFKQYIAKNDGRIIVLRGHDKYRENIYKRTVQQESAQAVFIAKKNGIKSKNIKLRLPEKEVDELIKSGNNVVANAYKAGGAFKTFFNGKEFSTYSISDRNAGLGEVFAKKYYACSDRNPGIMDIWCPADIYVYNNKAAMSLNTKISSINNFATVMNDLVDEQDFIPISLKLNNKNNAKMELINGDIKTNDNTHVLEYKIRNVLFNTIVMQVAVNDNGKTYIVNMDFKQFNNHNASIELAYSGAKKLVETEITTNIDGELNTTSKLGKAKLNYFNFMTNMLVQDKTTKEDVFYMKYDDTFTKWVTAHFGNIAKQCLPGQNHDSAKLYNEVRTLWGRWLVSVYKYAGNNEDKIKEALLYTVFAGEKVNYNKMNQFPKYYKIS